MPDLSIIIVTYNSESDIVTCLDSIGRTKGDLDIEIIVVDNNSKDNTVKIILSKYPDITLIVNDFNAGFPAANNQGIAASKSKHILLLNPDTELCDNGLQSLVDFLRKQMSATVVGLNVRNRDGSFQGSARRLPNVCSIFFAISGLASAFPQNRFFNHLGYRGAQLPFITTVGSVSGAAIGFNRQAKEKLNGLDQDLFYYEDVDFCARAWALSIPVYFLPGAKVIHEGGQSEISNKTRVVYQIPVSRISYFRKHRSTLAYLIVKVLTIAELTMRLLIRGTQSVLLGGNKQYQSRLKGYILALRFAALGRKTDF